MHEMKPRHGEQYVEMTFRLDDAFMEERLLRDIADFNAQVEAAAGMATPERQWFQRLT